MSHFDLLVVGGGSGGVRAARIAASHGARVALFEEYRLGGTCVIRGCVPKKLMVYASRFAQEFEEAAGFGWTVESARFDWASLKARRDAEVSRLEGIYRTNLVDAGVQIFAGNARLTGPNAVTVALHDGRTQSFSGTHILIATGAMPARADGTFGHELSIDSNGFFELPDLPSRVVVQGAGYIALELACVLRGLGSRVDVVVRGDQILRGFDTDVRQHLAAEMAMGGIDFHFGRTITRIDRTDPALRVELDNGLQVDTDCVLRALGRKPNTLGLGLDAVGITLDAHGAIPVDRFSQTSVASIYAVGDVTNRVNLTPMAIREGHAFADTVFGGNARVVDHALVPSAVFTTPEAGVVGLTEEVALELYPRLDVYRSVFRPMKATLSGHSGKVLLKLLVDRETDRIVGFHGVGPDTGEMAQLVGVALGLQATKRAFDSTLAVHPTAAEELVTMRAPAVRHNL